MLHQELVHQLKEIQVLFLLQELQGLPTFQLQVPQAEQFLQLLLQVPPGVGAVLIDEVQFFDESIVDAAVALSRSGVHVIAAGLDLDYRGRDFGPMGHLLAVADDVTKVRASCGCCGRQASRTGRKTESNLTVLVGGSDQYEARCLDCWMERSAQ